MKTVQELREYIRESRAVQPLWKPILVSDSKGFTLRNQYPDIKSERFPLELWCLAGATTAKLVVLVQRRIEKALKRHKFITLYFWSGTCDITVKNGKFIRINDEHGDHTVGAILIEFRRVINIVSSYPDTVQLKFIEIPTISTSAWNRSRNHRNPDIFIEEDKLISSQVAHLNTEIHNLNLELGQNTLKFSQFLVRSRKSRGKTRARYSQKISLLHDGVHPGTYLSLCWIKYLIEDINRSQVDDNNNVDPIPLSSDILQITVDQEELMELL